MKKIVLFTVVFLTVCIVSAQQKKKTFISKPIMVSISGEPFRPPALELKNVGMLDENGNNVLDAGEQVRIHFEVINNGSGPARELSLRMAETSGNTWLKYDKTMNLNDIDAGEKRIVNFPVTVDPEILSGEAQFKFVINEKNGFNSDTIKLMLQTQAYKAPNVRIVDYQVSSGDSDKVMKNVPFILKLLVQNIGQGTGKEIYADVSWKDRSIIHNTAGPGALSFRNFVGELKPNESKDIGYPFIISAQYRADTVEFKVAVKEKTSAVTNDTIIKLEFNKKVSVKELVIQGEKEKAAEITTAFLRSDVDMNIPVGLSQNPNKAAIIIGNENYSGTSIYSERNVQYAINDAKSFREYARKTLGIPDQQIRFETDAVAGKIENSIRWVTELFKAKDNPELIFYYAGHGYPHESTKIPFLVPVNVGAGNLDEALPLSKLYRLLNETGAKKIIVILDACFSGGGRQAGLLAARGMVTKPAGENPTGNLVVLSAATGEQSALPLEKEKHGLFTYYLLNKLKETKGTATLGELEEYLRKTVTEQALIINNKPQNPEVNVSPQISDRWRSLSF
jgi:hypothetical protein